MKIKITKACTVTRYQSNAWVDRGYSSPRVVETFEAQPGDELETEGPNGYYLGGIPSDCYTSAGEAVAQAQAD